MGLIAMNLPDWVGRSSIRAGGPLALFLTGLIAFGLGTAAASADEASPRAELLAPGFVLPEPWSGDLDGMAERRVIRVLTSFSKTGYFLDGLTQRGTTLELLRAFERFVNRELGTERALPVRVQIVPVARDRLIRALAAGHADMAAANLTITPERLQDVDFSDPLLDGAREVVVTGPAAKAFATLDDLAGTTIHLRPSSSYWASVTALNEDFRARGLAPIIRVPADPHLEDEDLLEMVAAGTLPWLVVDEHKAALWVDVIPGLVLRDDLVLRGDAAIALALRKETPKLRALVDRFVVTARQGTEFGNIILKRYLAENAWVRHPGESADLERFDATSALFRRYAGKYGFDWLMLAAMAYQESRLDQSLKSPSGAVGIMQILPRTAADPNVDIEQIDQLENNIHAGVRYLRFLIEQYLADEDIGEFDRMLFALAAYNAGPTNLRRIRATASDMGLDPNVWFGNAEIAAARVIGRETPTYVANIAKYAYAYRLIEEARMASEDAAADMPRAQP